MKKITKTSLVLLLTLMTVLACVAPASAATYSTYTYSIDGKPMESPDAYTPIMQVNSAYMGLELALNDPRDMVVDDKTNDVYIVDGGNNRIVVLDPYYKVIRTYGDEFINSNGVVDGLTGPSGLCLTEKYVYVADTDNNRLVVFDREGNYVRHLEAPHSDIFEDNAIYKPVALTVDASGRIYVVSSTTYQGIISMNNEGEFQGFIGAQAVSFDPLEILWRQFQTPEQRALSATYVSTEYNNIIGDSDGFLWVTTSSIEEEDQQKSIRDKDSKYAPIKKLNASGDDILARNGFFGPHGEVEAGSNGASRIIDVALGPEGTWSIIDEKRSKVFTYDQYGNLLFAFGDIGMMLGCVQSVEAIAYQDDTLLLLDKTGKNITIYSRTEYGDILIKALHNDNIRNHDAAVEDWFDILQRNSNFDAAYVAIGKVRYNHGQWNEAMEYFSKAYDTENYSNAFRQYRSGWASKYFIIIPIIAVILIWLILKFFEVAKKVNKKAESIEGRKSFGQELMYAFHLIFHPFDGFWDLKHEQRGSVRAATFYIVLAIAAFSYNAIGRSYIFNPRASYASVIMQALGLLVPLFLWVVANWCLTTLFEGEGSFKDIYIAVGYSLVPLPMFVIPATALTNVLIAGEATLYNTLMSVGWVWVALLIFFGMMVTHDYSLMKNAITCLGTIVGMAFLIFIGVLFSTLLGKMVGFISGIVTEVSYRM